MRILAIAQCQVCTAVKDVNAAVSASARCLLEKSGWVSINISLPHMSQGQYIKSVFKGGDAELAGMLSGDHVLEVEGTDVTEMTHMKVAVMHTYYYHNFWKMGIAHKFMSLGL